MHLGAFAAATVVHRSGHVELNALTHYRQRDLDCGTLSWSALEFCIRVPRDSAPSGVVGPRSHHTNCTLNDRALSPGARPLFENGVIVYTVLETSNEALLRLFLIAR